MKIKNNNSLGAIEAPVPMHEQVYQRIVHALMAGYFDPGQKLTYRKVAEQLGTSAMPVRTAFQRLQALRALEVLPNGSVEVPLLTLEGFKSLTEARVCVEGQATELATSNLNGNHLRTIRHHCKERTIAAQAGDIDKYLQSNYEFKFAIYRHCGNDYLLFLIETLWLQAGPFLRRMVEGSDISVTETLDVDTHNQVVLALEAKDPEAARKAIIEDIWDGALHMMNHVEFITKS